MYFVGATYCSAALFLLTMTYLEGLQAHAPWNAYRVAGIVVCILWPVLIFYLMFKIVTKRKVPQG
ncbi:hypothetical protein D3C80_2131830 [compost metagenome]